MIILYATCLSTSLNYMKANDTQVRVQISEWAMELDDLVEVVQDHLMGD